VEVNIGERAPLFTLRTHDKSEVHLNQYQGKKVVLLFFPLAFSSVCTKELCLMRDDLSEYHQLDAEVLAISVDSLYSLNVFREKYGYNFILLSDFNKETSRSYGALHEEFGLGMKGVSKRAVFVIDRGGIIRHKEILDIPGQMPDFDKVRTVLASIN
jgi:peroxiredoxin